MQQTDTVEPKLEKDIIVAIQDLSVCRNGQPILKQLSLDIYRDEIFAIVGGSGGGKTTLLRAILMLLSPDHGTIKIFGENATHLGEKEANNIQRRWGVMFQQSALFSSLTVLENVLFPLHTQTQLSPYLQKELAFLKLALVGLPLEAAYKYPSELSGGMQKRAALARAIALDPELLFLDEPTTGLDPHSAQALDQLILDLRKALNLTIIMVTHDMDSLWMVTDRVAFLAEGRVLAALPMEALILEQQPAIQEYFSGVRAERARKCATGDNYNNKNE